MNLSTPSPHRFALSKQKPCDPRPPPVPRTPLAKPASSRPSNRFSALKPPPTLAPSGSRLAIAAANSWRNSDTIQDDDTEEWGRETHRRAADSRSSKLDPIDSSDFPSTEYRSGGSSSSSRKRLLDGDEMLLDGGEHIAEIRFSDTTRITNDSSTLPPSNADCVTPSKRRRLSPPAPPHSARSSSPSTHELRIPPSSPLRSTVSEVSRLATVTTPRVTKPRFTMNPPERLQTPSTPAQPRTTPGPKAFIRPSAQPPRPTQPSPELFSPRRRGIRFVEGGMAAIVAGWIVEKWEREQITSDRRTQAAWRGWKPTAVEKQAIRERGLTVLVENIRRGSEKPGLGGLTLIRGRVSDQERYVAIVPRPGTESGAQQASEGDTVRLEGRTWEIQVNGVRWLMAAEGRIGPGDDAKHRNPRKWSSHDGPDHGQCSE